jgi:uncharacterized protein YjiS (DUF1127 family)
VTLSQRFQRWRRYRRFRRTVNELCGDSNRQLADLGIASRRDIERVVYDAIYGPVAR